jgi:hypothetical protein
VQDVWLKPPDDGAKDAFDGARFDETNLFEEYDQLDDDNEMREWLVARRDEGWRKVN